MDALPYLLVEEATKAEETKAIREIQVGRGILEGQETLEGVIPTAHRAHLRQLHFCVTLAM
jgi:hypothetical protein